MSNDRYSAGALAQRLLGLMSCAGLEQRFILYLIFFFFWCGCKRRMEAGLAQRGRRTPVVFIKAGWPWLIGRHLICKGDAGMSLPA